MQPLAPPPRPSKNKETHEGTACPWPHPAQCPAAAPRSAGAPAAAQGIPGLGADGGQAGHPAEACSCWAEPHALCAASAAPAAAALRQRAPSLLAVCRPHPHSPTKRVPSPRTTTSTNHAPPCTPLVLLPAPTAPPCPPSAAGRATCGRSTPSPGREGPGRPQSTGTLRRGGGGGGAVGGREGGPVGTGGVVESGRRQHIPIHPSTVFTSRPKSPTSTPHTHTHTHTHTRRNHRPPPPPTQEPTVRVPQLAHQPRLVPQVAQQHEVLLRARQVGHLHPSQDLGSHGRTAVPRQPHLEARGTGSVGVGVG
jgi:hypothetical protein